MKSLLPRSRTVVTPAMIVFFRLAAARSACSGIDLVIASIIPWR